MATIIKSVDSITSSNGWYFENIDADSLYDLEPVVCFALVSTIDSNDLSSVQNSIIIPISSKIIQAGLPLVETDILSHLISPDGGAFDIVHESKFRNKSNA